MDHDGHGFDDSAEGGSSPGGSRMSSGVATLTALSGRPAGPGLVPPSRLMESVRQLGIEWGKRSADLGTAAPIDPAGVLVERAVLNGFHRGGDVSCGGSARLLRSADGWLAVNLPRPDDWDLVDAWLQPSRPIGPDRWTEVAAEVARLTSRRLTARSTMLGLPVGALGERSNAGQGSGPSDERSFGLAGVRARRGRTGAPVTGLDGLVVVDLSALWAGPLAARLLSRAGARVIKVESLARPDGARYGSIPFFRAMNAGKESVALDLDTVDGIRRLRALVSAAHVVVSAARPRALEQLGLAPGDHIGGTGPRVWLSITGYGSSGPSAVRVAFGDDAAVAGGLVVWDEEGPCFCGDAIADPLSGMTGAIGVLAALERGGGWELDVSMADVAAGFSGPAPSALVPAERQPPDRLLVGGVESDGGDVPDRQGPASVPVLGADSDEVLSSLGIP